VLGDHPRAPRRILQRRRSDVDPPAAGRQRRLQRLVVTDAAGHFHVDVEAADDVGEDGAVVAAPEGRIEVDQVDPARACLLPAQGRLDRVAEDPFGAGDTLHELDGLAGRDVDGRQQLQGPHGRRQ
jgi:hypothetical protein